MTVGATEAALALASVLASEAQNLACDDLSTVTGSMAAVRAAARELESALTDRGWGGNVLYGFGEPLDEEYNFGEGESELADVAEDASDIDEEEWLPPTSTRRLTYQGRFDYFVTDEGALLDYVEQRLAQEGSAWTREGLIADGPFFVLMGLDSPAGKDYSTAGLAFAGAQDVSHEIPVTLWEMDYEAQDDVFPTAT